MRHDDHLANGLWATRHQIATTRPKFTLKLFLEVLVPFFSAAQSLGVRGLRGGIHRGLVLDGSHDKTANQSGLSINELGVRGCSCLLRHLP